MFFLGELSALLTAALWSSTSIIFTAATRRVGSMQVNITRLILAMMFLFISILVIELPIQLSWNQILYLAISGFIGLVFGDSFLFRAFREIGARISMLIMSLAPPISALLAYIFLKESLPIWGIAGIIITIGGIAVVVLQRNDLSTSKYSITSIGILFAFCGAIGQGVGLIFAKMAFNESAIHGLIASFIRITVAVIFLLPITIATRHYKNPFKVFSQDKKALLFTTIGALLGPYLGITFSLIAVANTKVGIAATIMATPPIIMLPMVRIIYKEKLTWKSIVGAIIAVAGVGILFLR